MVFYPILFIWESTFSFYFLESQTFQNIPSTSAYIEALDLWITLKSSETVNFWLIVLSFPFIFLIFFSRIISLEIHVFLVSFFLLFIFSMTITLISFAFWIIILIIFPFFALIEVIAFVSQIILLSLFWSCFRNINLNCSSLERMMDLSSNVCYYYWYLTSNLTI